MLTSNRIVYYLILEPLLALIITTFHSIKRLLVGLVLYSFAYHLKIILVVVL